MKSVLYAAIFLSVCAGAIAQSTKFGGPTMDASMEGGDKIRKRFEDFAKRRNPSGAALPADIRARAIEHTRRMEQRKLAEHILAEQPQWQQFGPRSTGGRIKDVIVHSTDPNIIYIATAAGGVWKSTTAGNDWTPMFDDGNAAACGSICFDPEDPNVIYLGTGEQASNVDSYLGAGLFRSNDGGMTWETVGLTNVGAFSRIYSHPRNPDLLMAACMKTNGGVYKSLDRGKTWQRMFTGTVYDMSINPLDENDWFITVQDQGILHSADGGASWQTKNFGLIGTYGRISVQQSPTNPDILYSLAELNSLAQILKSTNHGDSWEVQYQDNQGCFFSGLCSPSASQAFYDNYIYVSPHDPNVAFAGGIDIWRTTNGGALWSNMTNAYGDGDASNPVHADQHCIEIDPQNANVIYAGHDGGMVKSTDGGSTWFVINNGLSVTQFYDLDVDPTRRERAYGGTQDNGTLGAFGSIEWDTIAGGDGMVTIVNHANPNIVYGNFPNGRPYKIDFGAGSFRRIETGIDISESALWVAPMVINPIDDKTMFHGRKRVWQTFDGGNFWFEASHPFVNNVSAIGVSPVDGSVVMAGSNSGELMLSTEGGFEWVDLERLELSNNYVTDIEFSSNDRETAWVSYSGYGTPNLWRTTDLGQSWTSIWEGMPNVPANNVEVHPDDDNILFVATDVGVFVTFDGGRNWMPYGKGLPRSPVVTIKVDAEFGYIRAATHGRSAWEAPLVTVAPTDPVITTPTGGDIFTGTVSTIISWAGFTPPVTIEYSVDDGSTWNHVASDVVGTAMSWKVPNWPTVTGRIRITSQSETSEQVVSRTFTIEILGKGGITKQSAVNWTPYGLAWDGKNGLWTSSFYSRSLYKLDATTFQVLKRLELPASVGDSLFTDITMDRTTGTIYMHRMNDSEGNGGVIFVVDTNGNVLRSFPSWARRYPTGLEFVNGQLIAGERDGLQQIYTMDLNGQLLTTVENPYQENYGPRCMAWDDENRMFQTCTTFPSNGAALSDCYLISMSLSDLSTETQRMQLIGPNGLINARGVEFDRSDKNFWISDFGGNIYKITGFDFVPPPVSSVEERAPQLEGAITVSPNPAQTSVLITLGAALVSRTIDLSIVDELGQEVMTIYTGTQGAGTEFVRRVSLGSIPSGSYRIVASTDGSVITTSMLVVTH